MAQRIGILGGTFDPVHVGHLVLAACARDQLATDRFLLIPNFRSPLKSTTPVAAFADRCEMLRLAVGMTPGLSVGDLEGQRGGVSYTIDTLRALKRELPDSDLFLVLGADALADFAAWKENDHVARLAHLVGVQRGPDRPVASAMLTQLVQMPRLDVSSSLIRARVAVGETIDFLTPPAVADYIRTRDLYRHG